MIRPSLWPDEAQLLLLRAALADGPEALLAFASWCARMDFEGPIEPGSARLLPLVHANLDRQGCDHPRMGLIWGLRRRAWVEAQIRIRDTAEALSLLADSGIRAMVTKGIPLALDYYEKPGLRPMADIDMVVDADRAAAAMRLLEAGGWQPTQPNMIAKSGYLIAARNAAAFRGQSGVELDLHWHLLHESMTADSARRFWDGAVPILVGGVSALRPGATHMLMHVMIHGMRQDFIPPLRWVADSIMILRKDGARIDWGALIAFARHARLLNRVALALEYLRRTFEVEIPEGVIAEACRARPTIVEKLERAKLIGRGDGRPGRAAQPRFLLAKAIRIALSERRAELPGIAYRWLVRRLVYPKASL
jgi:hypothetical protein